MHADYLNVKQQRYSPGFASSSSPPSAATPSHILPAFLQHTQHNVDVGLRTSSAVTENDYLFYVRHELILQKTKKTVLDITELVYE